MPINKDLAELPTEKQADRQRKGWPPDKPTIMTPVMDEWYEQYLKNEEHPANLPMAVEGASFRASWGGMCLRRIQYERAHADVSNLPSKADAYRFYLGHDMHDRIQAIARKVFTDVAIEKALKWEISTDIYGATHIDMVLRDAEHKNHLHPVEMKTTGGYQFKRMATSFQGPPEGPKFSALRQLALEAQALVEAGHKVARGSIIYLAQELVNPKLAADVCDDPELGKFTAQWDIGIDDLRQRWERQNHEFQLVLAAEEEGNLIPRLIPEFGNGRNTFVVDPIRRVADTIDTDDHIVDTHDAWMCDYCPFQILCASHADITKIEEVGVDG